jgi:dTDP-glucose 4,6-dehydratase
LRIVLTGVAGFLGSHLAERFLMDGHEVIGVDNLVTGSRSNLALLQEMSAAGPGRFHFRHHDVSVPLFIQGPVDGVLHFASPASPVDYLELPIQTLKVGSLGTHNMLGLAREKGARFLLASTSEVYGDPEVHPQTEAYWGMVNPVGPRGVYDEAKRFAEAITMAYHRHHGLDTRIVRIFNTYGPRMRPGDGRVVSNFIVQALRGEPLTLYGDGGQTRSFCYVDDEVEGIWRLFHSDVHDPVNIGNPREFTVRELAEKVLAQVGGSSGLVFLDLPQDDPKVRCPDISRARDQLGWAPTIDLDEGLRRSIPFFRQRVEEEGAAARVLR